MFSDYWLEKADYVNIEHITIGYNIPNEIQGCEVIGFRQALATLQQSQKLGSYPMINSYVVSNTLGY